MNTATNSQPASCWPALLIQAQYLNLLDYLVRYAEVKSITKDPDTRAWALSDVKGGCLEIAVTLAKFIIEAIDYPLDTNRARRAKELHDALLDAIKNPPHDLAGWAATSSVASLLK